MLFRSAFILLTAATSSLVVHAAPLYWDGAVIAGDPNGGAGTWNTTTLNWDTALTGGTGVRWTTNDAVFGGASGVVTLGTAITASSLTFNTAGYTVDFLTRAFVVEGGVFSSLAGNVFTLNGGTGSAVFNGNGNLTSSQSVTLIKSTMEAHFTGGNSPLGSAELVLAAGILNLRRDGANNSLLEEYALRNRIRLTGSVTIDADRLSGLGGTGKLLQLAGLTMGAQQLTTTSGNGYVLGFETVSLIGDARLVTNADTYLSGISETGGPKRITKAGIEALILRNVSTWTGGISIENGAVEVRGSGALGTGSVQLGTGTGSVSLAFSGTSSFVNTVSVGGTSGTRSLSFKGGSVTLYGDVALNEIGTTLDVASGSRAMIFGLVSGSKVLTKTGGGNLILSNFQNDFGTALASALVVTGGRVSVEEDGDLGKIGNGVRLNGGGLTVTGPFDTERDLYLLGTANFVEVGAELELGLTTSPISGTGGFTKMGKGLMRLDLAPTAGGIFTLGDGELRSIAPSGNVFGTAALRLNYGLLSLSPLSETLNTAFLAAPGGVVLGGAVRVSLDYSQLTPGEMNPNLLLSFNTGAISRALGTNGTLVISPFAGLEMFGAPFGDGERWRISGATTAIPFYPPYVVAVDSDSDETPHFLQYSPSLGFLSAEPNYVDSFNPAQSSEVLDIDWDTLSVNEAVLAARIKGPLEIEPGFSLSIGGLSAFAGVIFHDVGEIRGGRVLFGSREALIYVGLNANAVIESDIETSATPGGFTKFGPGNLELIRQNGNGNLGEIAVQEGSLVVSDLTALGTGIGPLRLGVSEFGFTGANPSTLSMPVVLGTSGGSVIRVNATALTLGGVVTGGVPFPEITGLIFTGGGIVRLANPGNTFVGDILVDGVELVITGQGAADPSLLGFGPKEIRVTNSGIFSVEGSLDPLPGTKRWYIDADGELNVVGGTLSFNDPNQLAGFGSMRIDGGGAVEIGEGQGDFFANVFVQSGKLTVSGSLSGSVTVDTSATLAGTGFVGAVDVRGGGLISAGDLSPGRFDTEGLELLLGAITRFDLDSGIARTGYDQVGVSGTVKLTNGNLVLDLGYAPIRGTDIFYLILNDGAEAVMGNYSFLNGVPTFLGQDTTFTVGSELFLISYTAESGLGFAGMGNDVAIRSIPEPGSAALLLLGLSACFTSRGKRRMK